MGDRTLAVAELTKSFDGTPVLNGVDLVAGAGQIVAVLGPSGSGKSTLLRCIAGLERPDGGTIRIGDQLVVGEDSGDRVGDRVGSALGNAVDVPPERRGVGMVFQSWALFPHLDVAANVGYGLPRGQRRGARVGEMLELVGLTGFERRLPDTLSGGHQQRVALARALAPAPGVLLLDEPFSNLDATLRTRIRDEVHGLLQQVGITTVFVTHDQQEAFVLGDTVALVRDGRVVQQATARELYRHPVSPWAAGFVGDANLLRGTATGDVAETAVGPVALAARHEGQVTVLVRPEDLRAAAPGESRVTRVEYLGHDSIVTVAVRDATIRMRTREDRWRPGDSVTVDVARDAHAATAWPVTDA